MCLCVLRPSPVEILRQFDGLCGLQVAQAAQEAGVRVKGHSKELEHRHTHSLVTSTIFYEEMQMHFVMYVRLRQCTQATLCVN